MSESFLLPDLVKNLPTVTDASGKNVLIADAQGALSQVNLSHLKFVSLSSKETAQSTMDIRDFTEKYVTGKPVGTMLTDVQNYYSGSWFINLTNTYKIRSQAYNILVTKNQGNINSGGWATVALVFFPATTEIKDILFVMQSTASTNAEYSKSVWKIPWTKID